MNSQGQVAHPPSIKEDVEVGAEEEAVNEFRDRLPLPTT